MAEAAQQGGGLRGLQVVKLHLEVKAAQRGGVEPVHEVGRRDENPFERLHARQHFIDQADLPAAFGPAPVLQKAVHLVDQQQRPVLLGLPKRLGDVFLIAADPLRHQVRGPFDVQRHVQLARQPAAVRGFPRARRPKQAQPASAGPLQPGRQLQQVSVGIDQAGVIHLRGQRGVRSRQPGQRRMALRLQRAVDQQLHRLRCLCHAHLGRNGAAHGGGPRHHGRSQRCCVSQAADAGGAQQVGAFGLNDVFALRFWRHRQLQQHVKTAHKGGVQVGNRVGQPQRWHGVVFQRAVYPCLAPLGRASAAQKAFGVVKHVLHLVKQNQCLVLGKKALRRTKRPQPSPAADGVALGVFAGHLKQLAAQIRRQHPGQLAFAGTRRAVQENVDALASGAHRVLQVGAQHIQAGLQVGEIGQREVRRRAQCHRLFDQAHRVCVERGDVVGEVVGQQVEGV